jgi:hypothetical protein
MPANEINVLDEEVERERGKTMFLFRLQWAFNILVGVLSAVAIGLAYADLRTPAQITFLVIAVFFFATIILTFYRYRRNQNRRRSILARLDAERNTRLLEVFEQARKDKNLPPDKEARDGFNASLQDIDRLTDEERRRQGKRGPYLDPEKRG